MGIWDLFSRTKKNPKYKQLQNELEEAKGGLLDAQREYGLLRSKYSAL